MKQRPDNSEYSKKKETNAAVRGDKKSPKESKPDTFIALLKRKYEKYLFRCRAIH